MKIGIDASRCSSVESTGTENYSNLLIPPLIKILKEEGQQIILYTKKSFDRKFDGVNIKKIKNKYLWTHLGLGPHSFFDGVDRLFIPAHVVPVLTPLKTITYIHDVCFEEIPFAYSFLNRWYLRLMTAEAVRKSRLITHSKYSAEMIKKYFKTGDKKILIVPPGKIEITNGDSVIPWKKPFILFVGRIETKKNIIAILSAFDELLCRNPGIPYSLVLIGKEGFGSQEIFNFHKMMKNNNRVIFGGYVSESIKDTTLRNASGVIAPSLCEGSSLVLTEARSANVPFAANSCGALEEAGGSKGIYNRNDWSESLRRLISNPIFPEPITRTWDEVAKEVAKVIISG